MSHCHKPEALTFSLLTLFLPCRLAADVLYDPGVIPDLVRILVAGLNKSKGTQKGDTGDLAGTCSESATSQKAVAYIATVLRNESTLDTFVSAVEEAGLKIAVVASSEVDDCFHHCGWGWMGKERIRLHRITC